MNTNITLSLVEERQQWTNHVTGCVEISAFDNQPVFNSSQRGELYEQGLFNLFDLQNESERYAIHTVYKPFAVKSEFSLADVAVMDNGEVIPF